MIYNYKHSLNFYCGLVPLTHCGLVTPYSNMNLVNIGSGNGVLPDGTKPVLT